MKEGKSYNSEDMFWCSSYTFLWLQSLLLSVAVILW